MKQEKKNNSIMILLFFGVLMGALDISVVGPSIPAIEKSMTIKGTDISWIFSIYLLFYLFGIPIMSKLSDVHGRKLLYISSITFFGIGSLIVALSTDLNQLLLGRAIQGFGTSGVFPVAAATIGDIFPVQKRGRALGILGGVFGIAFILGPILAGSILRFYSWNVIFFINLPIAAILIFFAYKLLPGKPMGEKPIINWVGIILMVIVLGSFSLGLNNINAMNFGASIVSWSVLPFLIIVLLLTPVMLIYERNQANSFLNIQLFKSKQLRLIGIIAFGLGLFQSSIVFLPKLAVALFQVLPSQASFMLLPLVLATAIIPPITGVLLNKIGSRLIIATGLIFAVGSLYLFSVLSNNITLFYIAEICLGIGLAIRASLKFNVLNEIGSKDRAASLGLFIIFISLGQLTGAALLGVLITGSENIFSGFEQAFLILSCLTFVLVLLSLLLKKRKKEFNQLIN